MINFLKKIAYPAAKFGGIVLSLVAGHYEKKKSEELMNKTIDKKISEKFANLPKSEEL